MNDVDEADAMPRQATEAVSRRIRSEESSCGLPKSGSIESTRVELDGS
ncbi:hypothetical protein ACL9RL_19040 [Plantibacter sp. Mn2098]